MLPFQQAVAPDLDSVNALIIDQLHSDVGLVENIGHYIVEAGGKRLRPVLVLLTAKCLNYEGQRHIDLAATIEFIHTATLLHDDVVDVSKLRRGRPTANANWGNAPSVLVGDFLYSRAFQMLVQLGKMDVMGILSDTTNLISEGEVQQLVNAKDPTVDEDNYLSVIYKKTAALFEAACASAAALTGGDAAVMAAARQYGKNLGMAFQLIDDALDYEGNEQSLGKNVGDDLAEGKPTLPLIHALQHCNASEHKLITNAIETGGLDYLSDIIGIVGRYGAIEYTQQRAQLHANLAREALTALPDNDYRQAMHGLTEFALRRRY